MRKWWKRLTAMGLVLFLLAPMAARAAGLPIVRRNGERDQKKIAITVDDIYDVPLLIQVLDLCDKYDIKITIFPVGKNIKPEDKEIWLRAIAAGHEIGNHTHNHRKLSNLSNTQIGEETRMMRDRLNEVLGFEYPMTLIRPPYGSYGENGASSVCRRLYQLGYEYVILWDVSNTDPEEAYKKAKNGSILLYHTNGKDVRCLETLIPRLLADGYELCTVSELLGLPGAELTKELAETVSQEKQI